MDLTKLPVIFFALGGIGLIAFYLRGRARMQAAKSWPTVQGTVTAFDAEKVSGFNQMTQKILENYHPEVEYTYTVDGQTYNGSRFALKPILLNPIEIEQVRERCTPGAEVKVRYNPKQPAESVLKPIGETSSLTLLLGIGCLALAIWMFFAL